MTEPINKDQLLTSLRNRSITMEQFRSFCHQLSSLIAVELFDKIGKTSSILVPILRSGIALLPAFEALFKNSPIGVLGILREETTAIPHLYYKKIPPLTGSEQILLLDPMIATGGSAILALETLRALGGVNFTIVSIISSKEGISNIKTHFPSAEIYTVAIDEKLDAQKFILPGLGDFGDRFFGTP